MSKNLNDNKNLIQWWKVALGVVGLLMIAGAMAYILMTRTATSSVTPENSPPMATEIIGAREWKPSSAGNLTCAANDADEDTLKYTWFAQGGTIQGEGNQVIWNTPGALGDYKVTVRVTDGKGGEATTSKTFKVVENPYGNDSPDMTIYLKFVIPSSSEVHESRGVKRFATSEIECVVPDSVAGELTYKWSSTGGKLVGIGLENGQARRVGWVSPGVAGEYKVGVIVSDKSGGQSRGEVAFQVFCCGDS